MSDLWPADIHDMHSKFDFYDDVKIMDACELERLLDFKIDCVKEEVSELKEAARTGDAEGVVDALIDICVFSLSILDLFKVDGQKAWDQVMLANMRKVRGFKEGRSNRHGLPDLRKPDGWTGPVHDDNLGDLEQALSGRKFHHDNGQGERS